MTTILTVSILMLITGFVIGATSIMLTHRPDKPVGTIRIDSSDPDGPYLFLELHTDIGYLKEQEQVTVSINTESYISQD